MSRSTINKCITLMDKIGDCLELDPHDPEDFDQICDTLAGMYEHETEEDEDEEKEEGEDE